MLRPTAKLAEAIDYVLNRWDAFVRYAEDGRIQIDNNVIERLLRPVAIGRKNYLFFGSEHGGQTAATLYTLVQSARRNCVDVWPYLTDVLRRIAAIAPEAKSPLKELTVDLGGGVRMEMVLIPAGEFLMGSPDSDKSANSGEKPQHRVRITKPFYLGKFLVTQEQWAAVTGNNPSRFKGPTNPVETVTWNDCQKFLEKLNAKIGTQRGKFVLPTEAQWEYACRAGSTTRYCFGDDESGLGECAWYGANSDLKTHPVGEKKPNAWGLYDMHGNVWECCADWYDGGYYANSPTDDPTGPATGSYRVGRGGGVGTAARYCRSADRGIVLVAVPGIGEYPLGLRVSLVPVDR